MQASNLSKWTLLAQATTADSSGGNGEIDMANFEGVEFCAVAGSTYASTVTITVAQAASTTATFVNVTGGTHATTSGNDIAVVDVYRPRKRHLRATLTTGTTAGGKWTLVARQYGPRTLQSATTYDTAVVSPDT